MSTPASALEVDLDLFRGPLHSLLTLIERRELPITRVSLVQVSDQFITLIRASESLDLDLTAEFLFIASRLLLLKSTALLPQVVDDEPLDDGDSEDDLEARLLAYRAFRDVAQALSARQSEDARMFARSGDATVAVAAPDPDVIVDASRLARAALRVLTRADSRVRAQSAAPAPLVPFSAVLRRVVDRIHGRRRAHFDDLVVEADDMIMAITMFLAVLELVRRQRVVLRQQGVFGRIELTVEAE